MTGPNDVWQFTVSLGGFIAVAYQLRVEPRRQRRAAAIEAYRDSLELRQNLRDVLPHPDDNASVRRFAEAQADDVRNDREPKDERKRLRAYLNYWETLATGALRNVIDLSVLIALSGDNLIELRQNYSAYFDAIRQKHPRDYEQLIFLVDRVLQSRWPRISRAWLAACGQLPGRRGSNTNF